MIDYENDCVGCEYCVNCGRDHVQVTRCDNCGEICYDGVFREEYGNEDLCRACVKEQIEKDLKEMGDDEMFELFGFEEVK